MFARRLLPGAIPRARFSASFWDRENNPRITLVFRWLGDTLIGSAGSAVMVGLFVAALAAIAKQLQAALDAQIEALKERQDQVVACEQDLQVSKREMASSPNRTRSFAIRHRTLMLLCSQLIISGRAKGSDPVAMGPGSR
jgi:hypothetical protein